MKSLDGMTLRELQIFHRFIEKANPPPILHRYRRACDWTIKELTTPEVHITGVEDLNDPFEYNAPLSIELDKLKHSMYIYARNELGKDHDDALSDAVAVDQNCVMVLKEKIAVLRSASGLICFSSNPLSNRMWGYYGDAHRGICIGYSGRLPPFNLAHKVRYADPTDPIDLLDALKDDPTALSDQVSCRKGAEWEFEQEFRIPVGPFSEGHTRLLPINPQAIVEIRLGAKISSDFRVQVVEAAKKLPTRPKIIEMKCNHKNFQLREVEVQTL